MTSYCGARALYRLGQESEVEPGAGPGLRAKLLKKTGDRSKEDEKLFDELRCDEQK